MPNPGSPQAMQKAKPAMPLPKGMMIGMMGMLVIMLVVMMFRKEIGEAMNVVFYPLIGFGGTLPVPTLVIAGLIMITGSTIIRTLLMDPVKQAKNQKIQSDFNKEMRQARMENNLFKLKKLQEEQPKIMAMSMETSSSMMKFMPITMIVIMPIYAWVGYFLADPYFGVDINIGQHVVEELRIISTPFGDLDLIGRIAGFVPWWIVVYSMISLPIGQLENKIIRFFLLKKRLDKIGGVR